MMRGVGIVNKTQGALDWSALVRMAVACELQLVRDFGPVWGLDVRALPLAVRARETDVPSDWLLITLLPSPDVANALGYHSQTPAGREYARVFTEGQTRADIERTLSHEVLEALADPACNRWAQTIEGELYAIEVCDPVQSDSYAIELNDGSAPVHVSNFVTPAWFDPRPDKGARFDFMGRLSRPFTMSPGGYVITMSGGPSTELDARKAYPAARTMKRGLLCGV